jgi:hypothetical protein
VSVDKQTSNVTYNGTSGPIDMGPQHGLSNPFVLYVGGPRKKKKLHTQCPISIADVGQAFLNACRRLHHDDELVLKKIRIQIQVPQPTAAAAASKSAVLTGWDCVALDYQVDTFPKFVSTFISRKYNR